MKNEILIVLLFVIIILGSCEKAGDSPSIDTTPDTISLSMGAGYANDIYYKIDSGVVATVPRANWDIAFHTNSMSSTIITNGGSGVTLCIYPKGDISNWGNVDTVGLSTWEILYNSDTTWTMGAFERNSLGHPDYGWGIYSNTDHNIVGDSIFVIKTVNGQFKKIWIKKKLSSLNKYIITFADINGANSNTDTIDCSPYINKNFLYYSLSSGSIINREPDNSKWDLLITKYVEMVPTGPSTYGPYVVTGVLSNSMRLSTMGAEHPESVPVNALVPVEGTPLEDQEKVSVWEMVRMIATARIIMPKAMVRLSAGRVRMNLEEQALCFMAGANSIFAGDKLLTTPNPAYVQDQEMFQKLELKPRPAFKEKEQKVPVL